jgi:ribosomal protein S18 acetylase RimI-like enzyme
LKAMRLETDHANVRAQKLYLRRGFELHERYLMTRWVDLPHDSSTDRVEA